MIVGEVLGALVGFLCVIPTIIGLGILLTQTSSCPSVNNRICNGNGVCVDGKVCRCDVLFSGTACQHTQVLGYVRETNVQCSGLGVASPFMEYAHVPLVCREDVPSFANSYRKGTSGWDSPACEARMQKARKNIANGLYTEADLRGTPICLCRPPYGGVDCSIDLCPRQIGTNEICSGNGNRTVGFMRNNTMTGGIGCQCQNRVTLQELLQLLTPQQLTLLGSRYAQLFQEGVCGRVFPGPLFLPSQEDYACRCDEKYYGEVCEFGRCPMSELTKRHCSGTGHPSFGFGAEKNTSRAVSAYGETCAPICSPRAVTCSSGTGGNTGPCLPTGELCGTRELACPADRPYRCPNRQCYAATAEQFCAFEKYTAGVLDRPTPKTCDSLLACRLAVLGLGARNGSHPNRFHVQSGVSKNLSSPLLYLSMFVHEGGSLAVHLRHHHAALGQAIESFSFVGPTQAEIVFRYDFAREQQRVQYDELSFVGVNVTLASAGDSSQRERVQFLVGPLPEPLQDANDVPAHLESVRLVDPTASDRAKRVVVDCDTYDVATQSLRCSPRVRDFTFDSASQWILQPLVTDPQAAWFLEFDGAAEVSRVRYMHLGDVQRPCMCPPATERNESALNAEWIAQQFRSSVVGAGDLAVAQAATEFGDVRVVRGTMVDADTIQVKHTNELVDVASARQISATEFNTGVAVCSPETPFRCPNFQCARLVAYTYADAPVECRCDAGPVFFADTAAAECVCRDAFASEFACTCTRASCACALDDSAALFETELFTRAFQDENRTLCYVMPPAELSQTTNFSGNGTHFVAATLPLEFRVSEPCNATRLLARGFAEVYQEIEFECDYVWEDGTYVLRPQHLDNAGVFEEWVLENNTGNISVLAPFGVPVFRLPLVSYTVRATDGSDASQVTRNSAHVWRSPGLEESFVELAFNTSVNFVGLFVVFDTLGLYVPGFGAINVSARVDVDGARQARTFSDVVNGSHSVFVAFQATGRVLRLSSQFPMAVRLLVPFTDQECDAGRLYAVAGDTTFVDPQSVLLDRAEDCVCEDTCLLDGREAGRDGVCADFAFLTRTASTLPPSPLLVDERNMSELLGVYNGTTLVRPASLVKFTETATEYFFWDGSLGLNASFFEALDFSSANAKNVYEPSLVFEGNFSMYFLTKSNASRVLDGGRRVQLFRAQNIQYEGALQEGVNTCARGTDCADCGPFPSYQKHHACRRDVRTRRRTVFELVQTYQFRRDFSVRLTRTVRKLGRGPCGDCDGRQKCADGTCADTASECPTTRYNCPGDGCVRADVNRREYKCACRPGHSGLDCSYTLCEPLDVRTGLVDPHRACSCGAFPPLKRRPPFSERKRRRDYTIRDLLALNRDGPRTALNDVGWVNVSGTFAPYGYAFYWTYYESGVKFYTNCEPRVRDPLGVLRTLEECVAERDPDNPRLVTKWRRFPLGNGSFTEIVWRTEIDFNDAPYRCPNNYRCVRTAKDCFVTPLDEKPCGTDLSLCLADGTCRCEPGRETFVINLVKTKEARIPYYSVDGVSNPLVWNSPTDMDLRQYAYLQCKARNCSEVDCSPPFGCFAGTPKLLLADKLIPCSRESGHVGKCGVDVKACERGDVHEPLECWGNGILRKVDYRENEFRCQCGGPKSHLVTGVRQVRSSTELVPNGFGGDACSAYFCQDTQVTPVFFQRINPVTQTYYVGRDLLPLPGIWRGPCDAPVGPQIEDLSDWQNCCPGIKRLEKCDRVLCDVGSSNLKTTRCMPIDECTGAERVPRVYSCNNHGKPLADGSCECDRDEASGTGFTSDLSVFSYEGCFARVQCLQDASGRVCHATRSNERFDLWSEFTKIPYAEQQALVFAYLQGLPMTNQSVLDIAASGLNDFENNVLLVAFSNIAQRVQDAFGAVQSTVCVYPNDTSANPFGMVPYVGRESVVGPYLKAFASPYLLRPVFSSRSRRSNNTFEVLFDNEFSTQLQTENVDVIRLQTTILQERDEVNITYDSAYQISIIRVHARYADAQPDRATLRFLGDAGFVCGDLVVNRRPNLAWQGASNAHYCVLEYDEYVFALRDPVSFNTECKDDEAADKCLTFKDTRCLEVGGVVNAPLNFSNLLLGCNNGRCCVPKSGAVGPFAPTRTLRIQLLASPTSNDHSLYVDEVQVFGYTPRAVPLPGGLRDEMTALAGASECVDERYMYRVLGEDRAYYVFRNWTGFSGVSSVPPARTGLDFAAAMDVCEYSSGTMAASRGGESSANYARFVGEACFDKTSLADVAGAAAALGAPDEGCLVNAKNRNDEREPPIERFFDASCSQFGCWSPVTPADYTSRAFSNGMDAVILAHLSQRDTTDCDDRNPKRRRRFCWGDHFGDGMARFFGGFDARPHVYSDPFNDGGLQWQTRWDAFQRPWAEVFDEFYSEQLEQFGQAARGFPTTFYEGLTDKNDAVRHRPLRHWRRISQLFALDINGRGITASTASRYARWSALANPTSNSVYNYMYGTHVATKVPRNLRPAEDYSGVSVYWTNPEVCVVTFYKDKMCGRAQGWARRTIRLGPQDAYTAARHWSAGDLAFDQCGQSEDVGGCEGLGQTLLETKSVSVQGDCQVILVGKDWQGQTRTTLFANADNEQGGAYTRGWPGSRAHAFGWDTGRTRVFPVDGDGVWVDNCMVNFDGQSNLNSDWYKDMLPPILPHTPNGNIGVLRSDGLLSFRIVPRFTSRLVRVIAKIPKRRIAGAVTHNAFGLGYLDHPFMCGNVVVQVLARLLAGNVQNVAAEENTQNFELDGVIWGALGNTSLIKESRPSGRGVTWDEAVAGSPGETLQDSELVIPYKRCDGIQTNRRVIRCRECLVEQAIGVYEWNQQQFNPANTLFQTELLTMRQTTVNLGPSVRPRVHVSYDAPAPVVDRRRYQPLLELEFQNPNAFARVIARLRTRDYRRNESLVTNDVAGFYLDNCVRVRRNPIGTLINFTLDTTVCERPAHRVLCMRDYLKHVVQSGRQCDVCGPNSCPGGRLLCAGETAFTLFPLANASRFPYEHQVFQASLRGELNLMAKQKVDADAVMAYLQSLPQSLILSFAMARDYLVRGVSTRPGAASRGQVEDKRAWVDMNFARWFPYDCGRVFSKLTGVPRERAAVSAQYCDPDAPTQYVGAQMSREDIPTVFLALDGQDTDVRLEKSCGKVIKPSAFLVRDENGGPAILASRDFAVYESTAEHVILKFWRGNGTFRNTGKRQGYVFLGGAVLTGSVVCSALPCAVDLVVSTLSPSYGEPVSSVVVGAADGTGSFRVTVPSLPGSFAYQTLGFVVRLVTPQSTVRIDNVLVTDDASVAKCTTDQTPASFVELPSSVDSPHPVHACVYSKRQAVDLGVSVVGQCYCSDSSPFGGPSCEWPAVISFRGKHVCNSFGDYNSRALNGRQDLVRLLSADGVYAYDDFTPGLQEFVYQCKCRGDVGKVIRTRLDVLSVYDFAYVVRSDNLPNAPLFIEVSRATVEDEVELPWPVPESALESVCQSQSAELPSFISAEELAAFFVALQNVGAPLNTVLDLARDADLNFRWAERSHLLYECDGEEACGGSDVSVDIACPSSEVCRALHWNNVAFAQTGTFLTDGRNQTSNRTLPYTFALNRTLSDVGVNVEIWSDDASLYTTPLAVATLPLSGSCAYVGRSNALYRYACADATITSLSLSRSGNAQVWLREIAAYPGDDQTRPVGLFAP